MSKMYLTLFKEGFSCGWQAVVMPPKRTTKLFFGFESKAILVLTKQHLQKTSLFRHGNVYKYESTLKSL